MTNTQPPNASDATGARGPSTTSPQRERDRTPSTSDSPLANALRQLAQGPVPPLNVTFSVGRHSAGSSPAGWRWPAHLEQLAHEAIVRHVVTNEAPAGLLHNATVCELEQLADVVLCALAPAVGAKDARITELLGVVGRLRDEADGTLMAQDVHAERTADAKDGAEQARAW